ncbi:hypothetical protein [Kitasatospora sp. MBT66]|uniref:hypothetical protein n=1 Tax=Kitasatospora sp. MBT66 TaxID=1444769 RepID=UPI0005B8C162|nr:hypothetical protein [Kitasatospora sp. MBT66]
MSTTTTWWTKSAYADTHDARGTLHIHPGGLGGDQLTIYQDSKMPAGEMLAIADRFLAEVQRWRDGVAKTAAAARSTADDLAAAQARIAELESAAERSRS